MTANSPTAPSIGNYFSAFFGIVFFGIGVVNTFWGNDPGFGVFIVLLSLAFFHPVTSMVQLKTGIRVPKIGLIRFLLALFLLWAALGVGELFDKVDMMLLDLK